MLYEIDEPKVERHSEHHLNKLRYSMDKVNSQAVIDLIRDALNENQMRSLNVNIDIKNESTYYSPVKKIVIYVSPDQVLHDGTAICRNKEYYDWCQNIKRYPKLKPEWLHRTFKESNGAMYTVTGINTKAHQYPILATKQYRGRRTRVKMSVDHLCDLILN